MPDIDFALGASGKSDPSRTGARSDKGAGGVWAVMESLEGRQLLSASDEICWATVPMAPSALPACDHSPAHPTPGRAGGILGERGVGRATPQARHAAKPAAGKSTTVKPAPKARRPFARVPGLGADGSFHPAPSDPGLFPIGVWYQPTYSFDKWKALGVNTLVGYESLGGTVSLDQWNAAAVKSNLYMIRQPRANPAADKNENRLLAWLMPDEPEVHNTPQATLQSWYNAFKQADPNRPLMENFAGGYVLHWQGNKTSKDYKSYTQTADWVSSDVYPVTGWNLPERLNAPGQAVEQLGYYSNYKPQFAIIETSNQRLWWVPGGRGVTPDELRAEVWDAILHGARGITYFPQQIGGFQYDATPPDVAAEMAKQDARITDLAAVLTGAPRPAGLGIDLPPGFEGFCRSYGGKSYFFVLNMSASAKGGQAIHFRGVNGKALATVRGESRSVRISNGTVTDAFAPYEVHVYEVA